jgi:hypothetical protein
VGWVADPSAETAGARARWTPARWTSRPVQSSQRGRHIISPPIVVGVHDVFRPAPSAYRWRGVFTGVALVVALAVRHHLRRWSVSPARCLLHEAPNRAPLPLLQASELLHHPLQPLCGGLSRVLSGTASAACASGCWRHRRCQCCCGSESLGHIQLAFAQEFARIVDNPRCTIAATAATAACVPRRTSGGHRTKAVTVGGLLITIRTRPSSTMI